MAQQNLQQPQATANAVAPAQQAAPVAKKSPVNMLNEVLNNKGIRTQLENALQSNKGTFCAALIELFSNDTKLQRCDPTLVVKEALKAAVLRLPINKALGQAFIIAYNNTKVLENGTKVKVYEPTFQIGYKGLYKLAMRTGKYRIINADVVYEGELRKKSKLTGEIDLDGERTSDKVIGYFAYIELLNGYHKALYMTVEEVATHAKRYSKALMYAKEVTIESLIGLSLLPVVADSGSLGWLGNFHGMAIKTVLRNLLSKYGYLSVELQQALDSDEMLETNKTTAQPTPTKELAPQSITPETVDYEEVNDATPADNDDVELPTAPDPGF